MPKRSSIENQREEDENTLAKSIVDQIIAETESDNNPLPESSVRKEKNPAAVALGRLGGLKGGKARAVKLSASRRTAIAKEAARTRWQKGRKGNE